MTISALTGDERYVSRLEPELNDLANMAAITREIVFDVLEGQHASSTGCKEYKFISDEHLKMMLFAVSNCSGRAAKLLQEYYEHLTRRKS